jgi:hypothetical protein
VPQPTAILYIDGFNLYRRCLEGHPEVRWLNLWAFAHALLPDYDVVRVHYFTAKVKPGASPERNAHQRQDVYLRAVRTLAPNVEIHLGTFRIDTRVMAKHPVETDPESGQYVTTKVRKIEEKGSDVNLAVRMVADAFEGRADSYVMLSNDSDQVGPLRIMKDEVGVSTGIVLPMESARGSKALMATGPDFVGHVTRDVLEASQFSDVLEDKHGKIHRPPTWSRRSEGPRDARAF